LEVMYAITVSPVLTPAASFSENDLEIEVLV